MENQARTQLHAAGPHQSTALDGAGREARAGRGWTGLRAKTRGGPGRAGPLSKMYCWVSAAPHPTVTELSRSNDSLLSFIGIEFNRATNDLRAILW